MLNIEQINALREGSIVHLSTTKEEWELSPIPSDQKKNFDYCDFIGKCIACGLRHNLMTGHNVFFNKEDLLIYNLGHYQEVVKNSPWISCKDSLPNEGEQVFVNDLHRGYLVAYLEKYEDGMHFIEKQECIELEVESWMRIPQ